MDTELGKIRTYAKTLLEQSGSHGFDHVLRVTRLCEQIGSEECAEMKILIPAALLHDIARPIEKEKGIPHEIEGAKIAEMYLRSIGYPEEYILPITRAIRTHRFSTGDRPEFLEARILSDADKLDAMGAAGIARTFLRAAEHGGGIENAIAHFHGKLLQLKDQMYTESGKKIAKERHTFLKNFLATLEAEMDGSRA
ncbi:MAG: HD domain-containing protein [Methanoregulaceae archaeon]